MEPATAAEKESKREASGGRSSGRQYGGANSPQNVATPSRGRGRDNNAQRERGPSSALEDLMRKRGVEEAWNSLEEMQLGGTTTDKYTVSRMLMKTVGDGRARMNPTRVYRAISLVEKFIEMQPTDVDEVLFNALLDTCGRLKDLPRLEALVQRMKDLQVTPSPVTLGILVKTYGQAGDIEKVLQVWGEMEKQRVHANAVTYGCMIDACVKCGHLATAVDIFKGMRQTGKHRNTILYTTLIKGYGLEKDLQSALALFKEMPQEGVPYNTITYNSIIDACVKGGDLATAEMLLHEIASSESPIEPDLITFSTLLKGYCHIGDLDKALQLAEAIKSRGLRCDELVYNTLMDGCVKANDVTAGVGLFEEMVQAGMRPSTITNSILARLYQRAGYEEDANEAVSQLYRDHGIDRPGGDGKGQGRRNYQGARSPGGRSSNLTGSPQGSPLNYGMQSGEGCWPAWGETQSVSGYDGCSTPIGSPMAMQSSNSVFLPFEAMRGMPPPLPGMQSGAETPFSSSCPGPMSGTFQASPMGSPHMSPAGEQQLIPIPVNGLPSWPFSQQGGSTAPACFMQQSGGGGGHAVPAQGWATPIGGSGSAEASFPMPLSPPHDSMACASAGGQLSTTHGGGHHTETQQPYFDSYTPKAQVGAIKSPFCL